MPYRFWGLLDSCLAAAELEQRAAKRYAQQQADYEAKMKEREDKEKKRGRKLGGKVPTPPEPGPQAKDQANFTDGDSRIMPTASGFEQAYNAQASVDMATMLIVGQHVSQNTNDKQEVAPALQVLISLPDDLGNITKVTADSGYFSKDNTQHFEKAGIEPYMPNGPNITIQRWRNALPRHLTRRKTLIRWTRWHT